MSIRDTLSIAFKNLWRRKLRAFLTVLGMVIGTAAIVVMVSLGIGINESFRESIERAGSLTTITVTNYRQIETSSSGTASVSMSRMEEVVLDNKAVDKISQIEGVEAVMPMFNTWGMVKSGQYVTDLSIVGVDLAAAEKFQFELSEGQLPKPHVGSTYEIVFNSWTLQNFYNPKNGRQAIDSMGNSKITMNSKFQFTFDYSNVYDYGGMWEDEQRAKGKMYKLEPVGILSEEGNNYAWYCIMDINALKKLLKENKEFTGVDTSRYYQIWVKCKDTDSVLDVRQQILDLGYGAESLLDQLQMANESTASLRLLLGAIGGVSLFIAAIGIMNTMMMSIYERTREIGIIKVIGCKMGNIAGQFLTEAAYIGLFGGALGLGVSYGLSFMLNKFIFVDYAMGGMKSVIPLYLSAGAVGFSIVVALISGMYPALRAMRLSALTAIRNE